MENKRLIIYLPLVFLMVVCLSACDYTLPGEVTLPKPVSQTDDQLMATSTGMESLPPGDTSGSIPSTTGLPGYDSIWSGPANGSYYLNLSGDETVWGSWNIDWGDGTMDTQTLPAFHQYDSIVDKHLLILRMCRLEDNLCINAEVWNAAAMLDIATYPPFRITSVEP